MNRSPTFFLPAAPTKTPPPSFIPPATKHSPPGPRLRRGDGRHLTHRAFRYSIDDKLTVPASGYNKRSRVEAGIERYKQLIGDGLRFRKGDRRTTEVAVAVRVLN